MAKNIKRHVSHIKSSIIENGGPKLPEPNDLVEGEIAINYASGYETLSVKNSSGNIATFTSDTTRDAQMETISYALNDLNERINNETSVISELSGSVSAMTEQISETNETLDEFQEVAAAAFNQLDVDKAERSDVEGIQDILDSTVNKMGETVHYLTNASGTTGGTNLSASWSGFSTEISDLYTGLNIQLKLPVSGHASGVTISVNGGTKPPAYRNASTKLTTEYPEDSIVTFVYDADDSGTYYSGSSTPVTVQGVWKTPEYNIDTTYTQVTNVYAPYAKFKAGATIYRYQILVQKDEDTIIPINTTNGSTGTSKTLTTEEFDPFGVIFYNNYTGSTSSGSAISSGRTFQQVQADLRYSFNIGNTLTSGVSVYMVTVPQGNGKVKLAPNPISQQLPTEEDGYVYIYLGCASSSSSIQLEMNHPAYCYKTTTKASIVDGVLVKCKEFLGFTSSGTDSGLIIPRNKSDNVDDCYWHSTAKRFVKVNGSTYSVVEFGTTMTEIVKALSGVPYIYDCTKYLYDGTTLVASGDSDCYCDGHLMLYTGDSDGDRIDAIEDAIMQMQYDTSDLIAAINAKIDKFSEIISTALNDLNNRILDNRYDIDTLLNS